MIRRKIINAYHNVTKWIESNIVNGLNWLHKNIEKIKIRIVMNRVASTCDPIDIDTRPQKFIDINPSLTPSIVLPSTIIVSRERNIKEKENKTYETITEYYLNGDTIQYTYPKRVA